MVTVLLTVLLELYFSQLVRDRINGITLVGSISCLAWIGYCFGERAKATSHRSPWVLLAYVLPVFTTPTALRFCRRAVATALVPTFFLAGYFFSRPNFLGQQYMFSSLVIVAGSSVLSLGLGHITCHLNRENFFNERKLECLASNDQPTGLTSRRAFEEELEVPLEETRRYGIPLSLIMVDLDHFKQINDTHVHASEDDLLEGFGEILRKKVRKSDVAGRYDGEEFAVILPHILIEEAKKLADRVLGRLKEEMFESKAGTYTLTCSVGVTGHSVEDEDRDTFVQQADEALYNPKQEGPGRGSETGVRKECSVLRRRYDDGYGKGNNTIIPDTRSSLRPVVHAPAKTGSPEEID